MMLFGRDLLRIDVFCWREVNISLGRHATHHLDLLHVTALAL